MLPESYTFENFSRALYNPATIGRELHRRASAPITRAVERYAGLEPGFGIDVMAADWDNLIILDACRYDAFEARNQMGGDLHPVVSKASNSWDFMRRNFLDRDLHDTVYVTTNPYVGNIPEDVFYTVDPILERWNPESGTVIPEDVADAAREAHHNYPHKRLIVHFMQPHQPYLGPTADSCRDRVNIRGYKPYGHAERYDELEHDQPGMNWWAAVQRGHVSRDELRRAYVESLDIALESVAELLADLGGKSVITADHGELLGERRTPITPRLYGHSHDVEPPELRVVPWLERSGEERRTISHADESIGFERLDERTRNDRLQALGYID